MNNEQIQAMTKFIGICVRNEIEDFHCEYLNDNQMAELNPLIRAGIAKALYLTSNSSNKKYMDIMANIVKMIPECWEDVDMELMSEASEF
jgi:hypothetical protein